MGGNVIACKRRKSSAGGVPTDWISSFIFGFAEVVAKDRP